MVKESRLPSATFKLVHATMEGALERIVEYVGVKSGINITRSLLGGGVGTDTCSSSPLNRLDTTMYLFTPDLPRAGHVTWLPSLLAALASLLRDGVADDKLPRNMSGFTNSPNCIKYLHRMDGDDVTVEVELMTSFDWLHDGDVTYEGLYDELLRQRTSENLFWFSHDAAQLQKQFISEQPQQVRDVIKVVKRWCSLVDWKDDSKCKPPNYLLCLLVIRAFENACHNTEGSLPSDKTVIKYFIKLVLSTAVQKPGRARICWSRFYDPNDYNIEYTSSVGGNQTRDFPPIVQDPANPANNVADRPHSWVPFRRNIRTWALQLRLIKDATGH